VEDAGIDLFRSAVSE